GLLVLGAMGFLALAYRVTFVYELRPGACVVPPGGAGDPADLATGRNAASAANRAARPLRIVSYNIEGHAALIRGDDYLPEIAQVIRKLQPDIVALQEVHRGTWEARFADQAAELQRLTGMTVRFGPSFGVLGGKFGNAILTRGALRDVQVVPLPSLGEPRSLLRARVDVDGTELDFLVTHLAAWGGLNRRIRTRQARCLAEQARADRQRFVLAGDFNATPASAELATLLDGSLLRLCGRASEPTHPLLEQRIDYIFAGPGWEIGNTAVVHTGPSDHWPITAELRPVDSPQLAAGGAR